MGDRCVLMFLLLLSKLSSIWLVSHFLTFVQESGRNFSDQIIRKVFTVVLPSHAAWTVTYFLGSSACFHITNSVLFQWPQM